MRERGEEEEKIERLIKREKKKGREREKREKETERDR